MTIEIFRRIVKRGGAFTAVFFFCVILVSCGMVILLLKVGLNRFGEENFDKRSSTTGMSTALCLSRGTRRESSALSFRFTSGYLMRSTHQTGRRFYECE